MSNKIEKLNKKISRILGKKNDGKPKLSSIHDDAPDGNRKPSSEKILVVFLIVGGVFLWLLTGFYYVEDGYYGVLMKNRQIKGTVNGPAYGFTFPIPFARVVLVPAYVSEPQIISVDSKPDTAYNLLTSDGKLLGLTATYFYKIQDPTKLFNHLSFDQNSIKDKVGLSLIEVTHTYIANESSTVLQDTNLTILDNKIKNQANKNLSAYGLSVTKIDIKKLFLLPAQLESKVQNDGMNLMLESMVSDRNTDILRNVRRDRWSTLDR